MYFNLQRQIDNFKGSMCEYNKNELFEIDCKLLFKNSPDLDIKSAIKNYNKNCREGWKIEEEEEDEDDKIIGFPYQIIYDLIKEITDEVSNILLEIISSSKHFNNILCRRIL
jgi:hypothetical protein